MPEVVRDAAIAPSSEAVSTGLRAPDRRRRPRAPDAAPPVILSLLVRTPLGIARGELRTLSS